jgi:hypothetical protein
VDPGLPRRDQGLFLKAVDLEYAYAEDTMPRGVLGLNATMFKGYLRFIANRRAQQIGLEPLFAAGRESVPVDERDDRPEEGAQLLRDARDRVPDRRRAELGIKIDPRLSTLFVMARVLDMEIMLVPTVIVRTRKFRTIGAAAFSVNLPASVHRSPLSMSCCAHQYETSAAGEHLFVIRRWFGANRKSPANFAGFFFVACKGGVRSGDLTPSSAPVTHCGAEKNRCDDRAAEISLLRHDEIIARRSRCRNALRSRGCAIDLQPFRSDRGRASRRSAAIVGSNDFE